MPEHKTLVNRAAHRVRLVKLLVRVCRQVRRLQSSAVARAACDDVIRWLDRVQGRPSRRRGAK
ncbi:MAG: hypothetical protein A3G75_10650 [Verrucomicrobia bacterium RIFCSPLOWO2_12_FULL_64_8]|nr:MAG: hypothetical protein A3G75_10650 [Verrucomicrobia bacterium RIFCSPLOWO2_12_FULL_64_8]